MKVLWVVNFALPELTDGGGDRSPFGGWVGAMLAQIKEIPGISIGLAMKSSQRDLSSRTIDGVQCFWIPQSATDRFDVSQESCDKVLADFGPDILHLEGTEQAHSMRFISSWDGHNVVSLQGIISEIEPYEYGGLSLRKLFFTPSFSVVLFGLSLWANKRFFFRPRLAAERTTIASAQYFLGRTKWDRTHSHRRNPSAKYFSCNRILRSEFYSERWRVDHMQPHTIFVGNSSIARKGFHYVLEAVARLKTDYPAIRVRVAGADPAPNSISDWKKMVGYPAYVRYLVKKLDLAGHVEFLGYLPAIDMVNEMRRAHVYVLPSLIENSPNTLGEAMVLGVPCVSANVGGVPDMAIDGEEALLYRSDDSSQMARQVSRIFENPKLADKLSSSGRRRALKTHDPKTNVGQLLVAYECISGAQIPHDLGRTK